MEVYDVAIIGAGPAGLAAGIYVARTGKKAVILEAGVAGGQVFLSHLVENYPGFIEPVSGQKLSNDMKLQVQRLGVEIKQFSVSSFDNVDESFVLKSYNKELKASALIIATGSVPKKLNIDGEERLFGSGVSYCSTCDGMFFKNKKVFVVGGGNSALEAAEHLSAICSSVTIVHRRDEFRGDSILVNRISKLSNIEILCSCVIEKIEGKLNVESVSIKNLKRNQTNDYSCDGVFIYIGSLPQNDLFIKKISCTQNGYINVDSNMKTNMNGVFAAGDIVNKPVRQIVTAASDGCIAGLKAVSYLME